MILFLILKILRSNLPISNLKNSLAESEILFGKSYRVTFVQLIHLHTFAKLAYFVSVDN